MFKTTILALTVLCVKATFEMPEFSDLEAMAQQSASFEAAS